MDRVADDLRVKRAYAGRLGGIQKAINTAGDPAAATARARAQFLARFGYGTHRCSLGCNSIIPADLDDVSRMRAARLAQRAHFARMVHKRDQDRASQ